MKKVIVFTVALLVGGQIYAEESTHKQHSEHATHTQSSLTLNHGKKWEVDQVMQENMSAVIAENSRAAKLASSSKAKKEDYLRLSELISKSSQNIVSKCKLEPEADATFHIILADLLSASEGLKNPKMRKPALETLDHALETYAQYFDHPTSK